MSVKYLLKCYFWEKVTPSNLWFSELKFVPGQFLKLQLTQILLDFQTSCCNLKISGVGAILCAGFLLFWFRKELWRVKKQRVHAFSWKKTLIKIRRNQKWKVPPTLLERSRETNLVWEKLANKKRVYFSQGFFCPKERFLTFIFYLND